MIIGRNALKTKRYEEAEKSFAQAIICADGSIKAFDAYRMLGVSQRLSEKLEDAEVSLLKALGLSKINNILKGQVELDLGILYLDKNRLSMTISNKFLNKAEDYFRESNKTFAMDYCNNLSKIAVSESFIGQTLFSKGLIISAIDCMRNSHNILSKLNKDERDITYERNNLLWLAKASKWYRWRYAMRLIMLSKKSGDSNQLIESFAILIGNKFYNWVGSFYKFPINTI